MTRIKYVILLLIGVSGTSVFAQYPKFFLSQSPWFNKNGNPIPNIYTGGLSSPQFSQTDMNGDGLKDLLVFDRRDNKVMPFIASKTGGVVSYNFAPELEKFFPKGYGFQLLVDATNDGKEDLFTLTTSSEFLIHKNISVPGAKVPTFDTGIKQYAENFYPPPLNIQTVTQQRQFLPGITDLDGDGDIDIVVYSPAVGKFNLYQNRKIQNGLPNDTQGFKLVDLCYGSFQEAIYTNEVYLGWCDTQSYKFYRGKRHAGGSSILFFDNDKDADLDMVLGNASYNNLIFLKNGRKDFNNPYDTMVDYDTSFPTNKQAANFPFPGAFYTDIDLDGVKDLVVAPNAQSGSSDLNQIWYYNNSGLNNQPNFIHKQDNFLQDNTIDLGSAMAPVFFDYDSDGDQDLFCGYTDKYPKLYATSKIALFKNFGTPSKPNFSLIDNDFANISTYKIRDLAPTFGDISGDGKADLICGSAMGNVYYFKNTGTAPSPSFQLIDTNFLKSDFGLNTTPFLYDISKDGLKDLLIGEYNGNVNYFKNTGTSSNPSFTKIIDTVGKFKTNEFITNTNPPGYWFEGYSCPVVTDLDNDGKIEIVSGSIQGEIKAWEIKGTMADSAIAEKPFTNIIFNSDTTLYPKFGLFSKIAIADLNADGKPEMIVGTDRGGLYLMSSEAVNVVGIPTHSFIDVAIQSYPNPASNKFILERSGFSGPMEISVRNVLGQNIQSIQFKQNQNKIEVSCDSWAKGVYFIQTESKKFNSSAIKILVK